MTHFNSKEEAFKDILQNLEFDLDIDTIWEEVSTQIPVKEEFRLPIFFWFLSVVTGLLFVTVLFQAVTLDDASTNIELSDNASGDESFSGLETYQKVIEEVSVRKAASSALQSTSSNQTLLSNKVTTSKSLIEPKANRAEKLNKKNINLSSDEVSAHKSTSTTKNNYTDSYSNNPNLSFTPTHLLANQQTQNIESPLKGTSTGSASIVNPGVSSANTAKLTLDNLAMLEPSRFQHLIVSENNFSLSPIASPILVKQTPKWQPFFTLVSGPNRQLSKYQVGINSNEPSIAIPSSANEVGLYGLTTKGSFGVEYNKWRFQVGLQHAFLASRYTVSDLIVSADNEIQSALGETVTETTRTELNLQLHRTHSHLDAMIGVGRVLIDGAKWQLAFDANLTYNFLASSKGYFLENIREGFVKFSENEDSVYNTVNGLGTQMNLVISRRISSSFAIEVQPYYNKIFNPINDNIETYKLENLSLIHI